MLQQQECVSAQPPNSKATIREGVEAPSQFKCASSGFQDDAEGLYCQEQINRSGPSK